MTLFDDGLSGALALFFQFVAAHSSTNFFPLSELPVLLKHVWVQIQIVPLLMSVWEWEGRRGRKEERTCTASGQEVKVCYFESCFSFVSPNFHVGI
jgi:hypothetical protein